MRELDLQFYRTQPQIFSTQHKLNIIKLNQATDEEINSPFSFQL